MANTNNEIHNPAEEHNSNVRTMTGIVVSDKMDKTIVVRVTRTIKHPKYGKFIKKSRKFSVHDENKLCSIGDTVKIKECRPISKTKFWTLVEKLG
jgi:small subunit ribosomal protein S17